jgi:Ser/Thr protein kinase RdoA (MazF antagonist)
MPHIPGSHAKHYTSQLLSELAISHAKMHVLATNFTYKPQNIPDYYELREEYFVRLISDRDKLQAGFVDRAEAYTVRLERGLPSGLCHLDYGNDNILVKDGHIAAILDFDDLQYSPLIKCLAYTLWEVTFYNGPLAMEEYLLAYEILRKLSDEEKSLIKPCILFRHYTIGCLHMARGSMDDQLMERYLTLEQQLLQSLAK